MQRLQFVSIVTVSEASFRIISQSIFAFMTIAPGSVTVTANYQQKIKNLNFEKFGLKFNKK